MKIYHRIFGDPPSGGYKNSVFSSIGFPGGAKWADSISGTRLPLTRESEVRADGFILYGEAFEYQTLTFGQPAVIRSMVATRGASSTDARPHGFTHIAAPVTGSAERWVTDEAAPGQLLAYHDFLTLQEFWEFPEDKSTYPVSDWQPPAANPAVWASPLTPPREMMDALLLRYWKTLSARAFSDSLTIQPVEAVLSDTADSGEMIAQAKAFFAAQIIPRLPKAVCNILSMSVPVRQKNAQVFQPTALVFLTPEQSARTGEQYFDFRDQRFTPLDAWHTAFIQRVTSGERSPGTQHALATAQAKSGDGNPAHASFLADYQIIYGMESIEHGRIDPAKTPVELITTWRRIMNRLEKHHQIDPLLGHKMLKPVIRCVLDKLGALDTAPPMTREELSFLFSEALASGDEQAYYEYSDILQLITRHQSAHAEPFFLVAMKLDTLTDHATNTADMLRVVLENSFTDSPPALSVLQALTSDALSSACEKHPELHQVMSQYIQALSRKHPAISIHLMPLANRYCDPSDILRNTVQLMITNHVDAAPDAETCDNLKQLLTMSGTPEVLELLDQYFDLLFWKQRKMPGVFLQTAETIDVDMTGAVQRILATAAESDDLPGLPLQKNDLELLTRGLQPLLRRPEDVRRALAGYSKQVLAASAENDFDWFSWVTGLDHIEEWLPENIRITSAIEALPVWMQRRRRLLADTQFARFIHWLPNGYGAAFTEVESAYRDAFEALADAGKPQLEQLMPWFTDVSATPYIRTQYLWWVQRQALAAWAQAEPEAPGAPPVKAAQLNAEEAYWNTAAQLRARLKVCSCPAGELFNDRVKSAAADYLDLALRSLRLQTPGYAALFQSRAEQPDDLFKERWKQALVHAFAQHYPNRMSSPQITLQDLRDLEKIKRFIGANQALEGSPHECYCRDVLAAAEFCMGLKDKKKQPLIDETMRTVQRLRKHLFEQDNYYPMAALYQGCMQPGSFNVFSQYSNEAKIAVGLISTFWMGGCFSVKDMMKVLMGPHTTVPGDPYAGESLPFLQTLLWLFDALMDFDPKYPEQYANALRTQPDMMAYTHRLRSNRHFYDRFPQYDPRMPEEWRKPSLVDLWLKF